MARQPRTIEQARTNFEASIPLIGDRYRQGIETAKWAEAAASDSAEANFATKMQQVIASKSRAAGVRRVGDAKWKQGAIDKGVPIIGSRIQQSLGLWAQNFGQVYTAITRAVATLPPRTVDPISNIDRRLKPVVQAAVAAKIRGRGAAQ